jgi:hypothetical protein
MISLHFLRNINFQHHVQGLNPFSSQHVKQTPHDASLVWASNHYMVVFQGR